MTTIAALFVQHDGVYADLPDVDPWDEDRDARMYTGPHPVIAHPPCARWCQLAHLVESLHPHLKVGDDGGLFQHALDAVRQWGGVLEHPAYSIAWAHHGLIRPVHGQWTKGLFDHGWTVQVSQAAYGHRARKLTWLYYVGDREPPPLDWSVPEHTARLSWFDDHHSAKVEVMGKSERAATPPAFRDMLISLARFSRAPATEPAP